MKQLLAMGILSISMFSCTNDSTPDLSNVDCAGITPTYTSEIRSILNQSCALSGCHTSSSANAGIDLSSYAASKSATQKSKFLPSIRHESGAEPMPVGAAKLDDATILTIECWIKNGTPE